MRKTINIGDLGTIITGKTPPTTNKNYYGDYAVFIKPTDISEQSKYTYETEEMYSKLAAEKYESSLIPKGAICVPCIGTIGTKMTMTPCDCYTNQSINSIICNENYDNEYVYYLIKNFLPGLKAYNLGTASGREYVSKSNFEKIELVAEQDKEIQKKIGVILSRYDSLIENYQKQIKLLEEATQRLYKEWFVDLRFPGHENTNIVDGVPEGWEKKKISDVCTMIGAGSTPSRRNNAYWDDGNIRWVKTKELLDNWIFDTEEYITEEGLNNSSTKMFPVNTILMAIYASPTLGRLGILAQECCCNQAALGLVANEKLISWVWLYLKLFELRDEFNAVARGAGQQNISGVVVKNWEITVPNKKTIEGFAKMAKPYFENAKSLQSQLRLLTEARDRLLPKLMSDEFKV